MLGYPAWLLTHHPIIGVLATFRGLLVGNRHQFESMNKAISTHKLKPIIGKVFEVRFGYFYSSCFVGFLQLDNG